MYDQCLFFVCPMIAVGLPVCHSITLSGVVTGVWLCCRPDVIEKLQNESDAAAGAGVPDHRRDHGSEPVSPTMTTAVLDSMVYHSAVLKETLRMDSPGPVISRDCLEMDKLPQAEEAGAHGQYVPRGAQVIRHLACFSWCS